MTLTILETTVNEPSGRFVVRMILADNPAAQTAENLVDVRVTLSADDRYPRLAELQKGALVRARELLDGEIQRLQLAQGRMP